MDERIIKLETNICEDKGLMDFLGYHFKDVKAEFLGGKLVLTGREKHVKKVEKCFVSLDIDSYRRQFILSEEYPLEYLQMNLGRNVCYFCKTRNSVLLLSPQIRKGKEFLQEIHSIIEENIKVLKYDSTKSNTAVNDLMFTYIGKIIVVGDAVVFTKDIQEIVERVIRNVEDDQTEVKRMSCAYKFQVDENLTRFLQIYCPKVDIDRMENGFRLSWNNADSPSEPIKILDLEIDRHKEQLILTEAKTRKFLNDTLHRHRIVCFLVAHLGKVYGIIPSDSEDLDRLRQKVCEVIDSSICVLEERQKSNDTSGETAHTKNSPNINHKEIHLDVRHEAVSKGNVGSHDTERGWSKSDDENSLGSFQNNFEERQNSISEHENSNFDIELSGRVSAQTNVTTHQLEDITTVACAVGQDESKKENQFEISGNSSNNEFNSSYEHVNRLALDLDSDLADYILENKTFKIRETANQHGYNIENDNGEIVIVGQNPSKLTSKVRLVAERVCMYSTFIDGEKMEKCQTNSFNRIIKNQKKEGVQVTLHPCHSLKVVHSIMYKGVKVSLIHGSAADIPQTDVLLCPLDNKLNPACAAAKHIISKGGSNLREEGLQIAENLSHYNQLLDNFKVLPLQPKSRSAKEFQAKKVLGIILKDESNNIKQFQSHMAAELKTIFEKMVKKNFTSYTFPLEVGLKVPATVMAKACCWAIKEVLHKPTANVKEVYLCIVNEKYLQALTTLMNTELETDRKKSENQKMNERVEEPLKPIKTTFYDQSLIEVKLVPGSVTDQKVDAIVVPVNSMLTLANGAISKQVLKMAGQSVQEELKKKHSHGIGPMEVTYTKPGNLDLKYLLFSSLPELKSRYGLPAERVHILMRQIFRVVKELRIKSIALPALGTGALKYPDDVVAMEMMRVIYMYAAASGIREIRVVVYIKESPQYKLFERAVEEHELTVKRASKVWFKSPLFVELDHKETRFPIEITSNAEEKAMCDVEILLRKPIDLNSKDIEHHGFIYVREIPSVSLGLTRIRIGLDMTDPRIDDHHIDELYEKMLKLAVKEYSAKFLWINIGKCEPASEATVIIGKFLKKITNVKTWDHLQIRFLVSEEGLKACMESAKEQGKGKSSFLPFLWRSSEFKWQVAEMGVRTEGGYMVICSENEEKLQTALSEINIQLCMGENNQEDRTGHDGTEHNFSVDRGLQNGTEHNFSVDRGLQNGMEQNFSVDRGLSNVNKNENKLPIGIVQSGSTDNVDEDAGEYVILKDVQRDKREGKDPGKQLEESKPKETKLYEKFHGNLRQSTLRHLSTRKLNQLQDSLKDSKQCQVQFINGSIHLSIPYEQRHLLVKVLDDNLNNLDKSVYFVRNVSLSTFHLMELHFQLNSYDWKYHEFEQELEIRKFEDVYQEAEDIKARFDTFQMDSIDVTQNDDQVPNTIQEFNDQKEVRFQNIILEAVSENKVVNIHYPVEEQNIASEVKNLLQVKLQLKKQTGRRHRKFGDFTSLQPSFTTITDAKGGCLPVARYQDDSYQNSANSRSRNKPQPERESSINRTIRPSDSHYQSLPVSHKSLNFTSFPVRKAEKVTPNAVYRTGKDMKVMVYKGDITNLNVECIVNAANESLMHGGGVAAVIARAAGRELQRESKRYIDDHGPLQVSECIPTTAGKLPYKYVLHAVGPQWGLYKDKGDCADDLRNTIVNILRCTEALGLKSVAIPSISSGIFGVPWDVCAQQYALGLTSFEEESNGRIDKVHFVDINEHILKEICDVFNTEFIPIENVDNNEIF